jgi:hypothetical protein
LVAAGGVPAANKAGGNNPAVAMMAVLGSKPLPEVTLNEFTTIASVWTHAQFLDGSAIKGHTLGLRIAAGNLPNFVDLTTGGWGDAIQDPGRKPAPQNVSTKPGNRRSVRPRAAHSIRGLSNKPG